MENSGKESCCISFHLYRICIYMNVLGSYYNRVSLTKLRVSAHPLRIETGRYNLPNALPPEQRVCWFCNNGIEDEVHFLLDCPIYSEDRKILLNECYKVNKSFGFLERRLIFNVKTTTVLQYSSARYVKTAY